jgi:hypothetical protein
MGTLIITGTQLIVENGWTESVGREGVSPMTQNTSSTLPLLTPTLTSLAPLLTTLTLATLHTLATLLTLITTDYQCHLTISNYSLLCPNMIC